MRLRMDKEITINNEELAKNLVALALVCECNDTDNCDMALHTKKGNIIAHIDFEYEIPEA